MRQGGTDSTSHLRRTRSRPKSHPALITGMCHSGFKVPSGCAAPARCGMARLRTLGCRNETVAHKPTTQRDLKARRGPRQSATYGKARLYASLASPNEFWQNCLGTSCNPVKLSRRKFTRCAMAIPWAIRPNHLDAELRPALAHHVAHPRCGARRARNTRNAGCTAVLPLGLARPRGLSAAGKRTGRVASIRLRRKQSAEHFAM